MLSQHFNYASIYNSTILKYKIDQSEASQKYINDDVSRALLEI